MTRTRHWVWISPALLCLPLFWHCSQKPVSPVPPIPGDVVPLAWKDVSEPRDWNILLMTLDATRRDMLGVYGDRSGATPNLDSLALLGATFEEVVTPVPITLPAHTTLLTGIDPYGHGARHNAIFTVSDTLVTLPERFQEHGYQTAAFVSGYPLDHSFGLAQGFDHYDDIFSERTYAAIRETAERKADEVNQSTFRWVKENLRSPFFLWVHYFDPHYPYEPPEVFESRFPGDPYRAEVAFMDEQVGKLLREFRDLGILENTFILILGDHGESLGEHKESTHSFFVYDATQLVPCILIPPGRWDGPDLRGRRITPLVRVRDLAPTIANLLGWSPEPWRESGSFSLLPVLEGSSPTIPVAYVESLVPALEYGWSDLRGVRTHHWKYIRAPKPELYHLPSDPGELENVVEQHPDVAKQLEGWLDWCLVEESAGALQPEELSPEVLERLRSLGYLGGGVASGEETRADPKDRIDVYLELALARQRGGDYKYEDAVRILRPVVREHPELLEARRLLALYSYMSRDLVTARDLYEDLAEREPDNPSYRTELVPVLIGLGEHDRALEVLNQVRETDPEEKGLDLLQGQVLEAVGRLQEAVEFYRREAVRDPESATLRWNVGRVLQVLGRADEARRELYAGLAADPTHPPTLAALAELAYAEGESSRGDSLLDAALRWDPHEPQANYRKGRRARGAGNFDEARQAYERALVANPDFTKARVSLAVLFLEMRQPEEAQRILEEGLALGHDSAEIRLNLGVAFAQIGQIPEAATHWQRGLELEPSPQTGKRLRENLNQARLILRSQAP